MTTINIKRDLAHLVRHPNRPDPAPVIRCQSDIIVWHDSDTVTLDHLTRAEAERIYRLALTDIHLFPLTFALGHMLGIDQETAA